MLKYSRFFIASCKASNPKRLMQSKMDASKHKTAIIMLNMGGPQSADQVHDFLLRLFSDREIINIPGQKVISKWIAKRRSPKIEKQYNEIGGGSPILHWTNVQAEHMIDHLNRISPATGPHKAYVGFRYAHPLLEDTINEIERDGVERVVAFSQYPQYSCTTSGSTFNALMRHYNSSEFTHTGVESIIRPPISSGSPTAVWSFIDRWPVATALVNAFAQNIFGKLNEINPEERDKIVIIFSAHSIPLSVVDRGDSYPQEVGATVHAVMEKLDFRWPYRLVWQSKVGPAKWLGPSTQDTLHGLARLGYHHAMLVPIAFTSDHIETLYEMDIEYCTHVAQKAGMIKVYRAPAINNHPVFSLGLAELVAKHLRSGELSSRQYFLRCPLCINPDCGRTRDFLLSEKTKLVEWTAKQNFE